jgi:small-conductance mechanosensitive channel
MDLESINRQLELLVQGILEWSTSPQFYSQIGIIFLTVCIAFIIDRIFTQTIPLLKTEPTSGRLLALRKQMHHAGDLIIPVLCILLLNIADEISMLLIHQSWLIKLAESIAIIITLYLIITRFTKKKLVRSMIKWIVIPIVLLQVFGWLDEVTSFLDSIYMQIGNIRLSLYGISRLLVFGVILFWLGRISNNIGVQVIRNQDDLEIGTREVFAKLFQVTLYFIVFILLLQLMGINFTALAVFGGALGVGLGFGLQSIASNFISGIIILLDRSITVGDYIQLEDGRAGKIRELNMRSAILETYDGKDIMVPNEQFITTNFVNWTHKNQKQRYPIEFTVAYDTDLDLLFEEVRKVVASHPKVISGEDVPIEERPDAEIAGFGNDGIDILVEFWMEGIDDGENRVGAELLHMIWKVLQEHNIEIPYPQREVRVLNPEDLSRT